jgi:hypothetical protein
MGLYLAGRIEVGVADDTEDTNAFDVSNTKAEVAILRYWAR